MRYFALLIFCLAFSHTLVAQVFRSPAAIPPPPPPPGLENTDKLEVPTYLIAVDTTFTRWSPKAPKVLSATDGSLSSKSFKNQSFGRIARTTKQLCLATTRSIYEDGKLSRSELLLQLRESDGEMEDSIVIHHEKGIRIRGLTNDDDNFYVAFTKEISSGDRDLYVAKISPKAELLWETNIGKRFGTSGLELLKLDGAGDIVLFSSHYDNVGFDRLSPDGQIVDRKALFFYDDFSPKSFSFKPDGGIIGIGTHQEYEGRDVYTSSVIFELNANYQLLRYRQLRSSGLDDAQDVIMDDQGYYYFLTNTGNSSKSYLHDADFMTIGKLDQDFNLIESINLQNLETGQSLDLVAIPNYGIVTYQRSYNSGQTFVLFSFSHSLELQQILTAPGRYGSPNQMLYFDKKLLLLCGHSHTALVTVPWSTKSDEEE